MTVEIKIEVDFYRHHAFPTKENCDKCYFSKRNLCLSSIVGIREKCGNGQNGYWDYDAPPYGMVIKK